MRMAATKACSAMRSVTPSAPSRLGHSVISVCATSLGFGNRKTGTCATRQKISQKMTIRMPTRTGAPIDIAVSDCANDRIPPPRQLRPVTSRRLGEPCRQLAAELGEARGIAEAFVARLRLVDRQDLDDAAGSRAHDGDPRRQEHRFVDRVGDEHRRELALPPQLDEVGIEPVAGELVERAERLVHQQQVGLGDEAARDRHAHPHAAGQLARIGALEAVEPDAGDRLGRRAAGSRPWASPRGRAAGARSRPRAPTASGSDPGTRRTATGPAPDLVERGRATTRCGRPRAPADWR